MPTNRRNLILIMTCVFVLFSIPEWAQAQSITVKSGHPRVFITPSNLPTLQSRAATTHSTTYGALKNWCDANWSNLSFQQMRFTFAGGDDKDYDAGVLRYALIYALGTIPGFSYTHTINDYGDMAVSIMLAIIAAHPTLDHEGYYVSQFVAIAYDWVYPRMSTQQKATIVNWLAMIGGNPPVWGTYSGGYKQVSTPPSFYAGLAFYGDGINDTLGQAYINFIPAYLAAFKEMDHEAGFAGGHSTGLCYGQYVYSGAYGMGHWAMDLYALTTATNLTIADTFDTYSYQSTYPMWGLLYGRQPGPAAPTLGDPTTQVATLVKFEDCGAWIWNLMKTDYALVTMLRVLATVSNAKQDSSTAQVLTWLANSVFQASTIDTTWDIIFNDRTTTASSPATLNLPSVKPFGWNTSLGVIDTFQTNPKAGLGHVYMRSSWSDSASTTQAVFKAQPYAYFGHQHHDSLNFTIFKGEILAQTSGRYFYSYEGNKIDYVGGIGFPHHWYYYKRTPSANSILIMDPSEMIAESSDPNEKYYRDGGQRSSPDANMYWSDMTPNGNYDLGGLIKFEDGTDYTYSSADATKAYNSTVGGINFLSNGATPKTNLVQRDFVYFKSFDGNSDYFVVFDRVNSLNSSSRKVFLLHTVGEPIMNGTQTSVYGDSSNGLFQSSNTNRFTVTQATAKLFVNTLLPTTTQVYKHGGKAITTITADINSSDGTTIGGGTINIPVASTASFPDKPIFIIDNEAFMCSGKTANSFTGCIRGLRYYKLNTPQAHSSGATVTQEYAWMYREVDTGNWINHPHNYGEVHNAVLPDANDFGRWGLRIETVNNENNSNFLHVLFPTVNMNATMPTTALITQTSGDAMSGVYIQDPVTPKIVMFSPTTALVSDVTYTVTYDVSLTGKHLITDLVSNASYDISKNGTKLASKTASSQAIIYFEAMGGGSFRLVQTSGPVPPSTDTTPPSAPTNLTAVAICSSQINLSWSSSSDNVGVAGYKIYRNGSQIATSAINSYSDSGLSPSTMYSYTVGAYDAAGNVSDPSNQASATTPGDTTPPVRSGGSPSGTLPVGTAQTTLSLTTNENATCKYSTTAGTLYSSMINTFSTTGGTSHSTTVSGLSNATTFNYYVRCVDTSNNANPDDYVISFSVGSTPQPPPPPPSGYVINDFTFYATPSTPRPAEGVAFQDSIFYSSITRITNSPTDVPGTGSPAYHYAWSGYPRHDIENSDGTKLIMESFHSPGWHIWNANSPYNKIKDFPAVIMNQTKDPDPRWDNSPSKPNILYFQSGCGFYKWDVTTDAPVSLHDFTTEFSTCSYVSTREKGSSSDDSRYWAFIVFDGAGAQTNYMVFDKDYYSVDNGKVIASLSQGQVSCCNAHAIGISPSGNYVVIDDSLLLYPRDLSSVYDMSVKDPCYGGGYGSHWDFAYDDQGNEVVIDAQDYYPDCYHSNGYWYRMVDLNAHTVQWLAPEPPNVHSEHVDGIISHLHNGWFVTSEERPFFPPGGNDSPESEWGQHEVYMVEMTKRIQHPTANNHARVWRIAKTHTMEKDGYADSPYAHANRKGTKIWFGSGWGTSILDSGQQYDSYQINLPATWYEDLMGFNIVTSSLAFGTISQSYSQMLQAFGGASPYTWSLLSGALPSGLSLNVSTGAITGTPTLADTYNFTIQVRDSSSPAQTSSKAFSIIVPPAAPKGVRVLSNP